LPEYPVPFRVMPFSSAAMMPILFCQRDATLGVPSVKHANALDLVALPRS
jgi:hypothetical protein